MAEIIDPLEIGEETNPEEDPLFKYKLYQNLSQPAPDLGGRKLQDVYGTSKLPMYQWVKRIETGERTFDPSSQFDNSMLDKYRQNLNQTGEPVSSSPTIQDLVKGVVPSIGGMVASSVTKAAMDPLIPKGETLTRAASSFAPDYLTKSDLPLDAGRGAIGDFYSNVGSGNLVSGEKVFGPLATVDAAQASGLGTEFSNLVSKNAIAKIPNTNTYAVVNDTAVNAELGVNINDPNLSSSVVTPGEGRLSNIGQDLFSSRSLASAGASFGVSFGLDLIMGKDPVEAAKSAAGSAVGATIGTAVGGPIGGFIGGAIGKLVGGRVICNELHRQGLMARKHIVLDYKFTRDYLTPKHVKGYHAWAIFAVRQMRKGRLVNFWNHIATHRINEIAYIYGKRDNPDYLGKIYRRIFEPACWILGAFSSSSDWSILYKTKEI